MFIYIHGDDDFRSEQTLNTLIEGFRKKHDPSGLGISRLDGEVAKPEEVQRALATQGLLTNRRLLAIRSLSRNKKAETADTLLDLIEAGKVPADHVLIVYEVGNPESGKRSHGLFRKLADLPKRAPRASGRDFQERFDLPVGRQLERWVDAAAAGRKIRLAPAARALLVSLTVGDLRQIDTELEKFSHFRRQGTVTEADVKLFVHSHLEPNIFDLMDALGERDLARALGLLEQQLISGAAPLYLVTMLTRHLRILRTIQAAGDEHPSLLARKFKIHPFVVGKAVKQVRRFKENELARLFDELVSLDERLKSSATDPSAELTLFIARACGSDR